MLCKSLGRCGLKGKQCIVPNELQDDLPIEVEPSHENDTVERYLPLLHKHSPSVPPKGTGSNIRVSIFLCFEKLFTFWEGNPKQSNTNRQPCSSPDDFLLSSVRAASETKLGNTPSKNQYFHQRLNLHMQRQHTPENILAAASLTSSLWH